MTIMSRPSVLMLLLAGALGALLMLLTGLMGGGRQAGLAPASPRAAVAQQAAPVRSAPWTASAPGRVEPKGGEVRLTAHAAGRIIEVAVQVNDAVEAGDLLLRLDDDEARARLIAADAEAAVRRRERDAEVAVGRLALDRRQAEDTLAASERAVLIARTELDRVIRARRAGTAAEADVGRERAALKTALDKQEADRAALRRAQTVAAIPLPTRLEAGLTGARADVTLAELALERTRVRAPAAGTVLQIGTRVGETVSPAPEHVLLLMGDVSALRVRAEVEERDVAKVRAGQAVVLRSEAYPGRDFSGRVASLAQSLGAAKLAQRGPRRPSDVDTLEVMIDVDAGSLLLPGMRVDVFFRADAAVSTPPVAPPPGPIAGPTAPKSD
jgi:HlyD family secretion protein